MQNIDKQKELFKLDKDFLKCHKPKDNHKKGIFFITLKLINFLYNLKKSIKYFFLKKFKFKSFFFILKIKKYFLFTQRK